MSGVLWSRLGGLAAFLPLVTTIGECFGEGLQLVCVRACYSIVACVCKCVCVCVCVCMYIHVILHVIRQR